MKKLILASFLTLTAFSFTASAQETGKATSESYGNTLNIGLGIGYYGYVGHSMPVVHADYEFDVARNFTLAPFITVFSYQNYYYWGNPNNPYKNYYYRQTVIPIGVKGTYYFDQFLGAGPKWDFYLAASLGFAIRKTVWESGYYGETTVVSHGSSGLYLDGHIGTEYHMNERIGLFLDLSSGISTFGLSFHL
jgi:hypothetical protein